MSIDRRQFLAAGAAALCARAVPARTLSHVRAIAFDGFVVFNASRALAIAKSEFPERGAELVNVWRARQFEYQWLRIGAGRYADFAQVNADSLEFAARSLGVELPAEVRADLLDVYRALDVWPDAQPALRALKEAGLKVVLLSNMTATMLSGSIQHAGLLGLFDRVLSTDEVGSFKPAPRAYALGPSALQLTREEILFVASAGWDVAGAKWFGYPTYWVNRTASSREELGAEPDGAGRDMHDLLAFAREH